jgi:hypothetical protein
MRSMNPCASPTGPGSPGSCPCRPIAVGFSGMRICHSSRRFGSRVRSTAMPGGCPRAEARLNLRPPERSALCALVRPHPRGRRLILAAAQSRPRNPSCGAAAARAAGNRADRVLFAVPQMGVALPGRPRSKLPGHKHLPAECLTLKCHSIEGGARFHIRKTLTTWSPLTESNRRPSPYHVSLRSSAAPGRAADLRQHEHTLALTSAGQAQTSAICHSICHSL